MNQSSPSLSYYSPITYETMKRIGIKQSQLNYFITLFGQNGSLDISKQSIEKIYNIFNFGLIAGSLLDHHDIQDFNNICAPVLKVFDTYAKEHPAYVSVENYPAELTAWMSSTHPHVYNGFTKRVAKTFSMLYSQKMRKDKAA